MKSILITGCNRGIGLGMIRHLVEKTQNPPRVVIATCRSIEKAKELRDLADKNDNVHLLEFDVKNFDRYDEFSSKVTTLLGTNGLSVLINNAGVSPKFTRIQLVKPEQMLESFAVNTTAPIMVTKALLPALKKAAAEKAVVVNITSILASISGNADGGYYPYRCSKAALNMATKSMSKDLEPDNIVVTGIHPGWVKTDMGGPKAPMEVEDSAAGIFKFISTIDKRHGGGFYQYDGKKLDW